MIIDLSRRVKD